MNKGVVTDGYVRDFECMGIEYSDIIVIDGGSASQNEDLTVQGASPVSAEGASAGRNAKQNIDALRETV